MRVLILGGTGYIGAHLAKGLAATGHAITVVARGRHGGAAAGHTEQDLARLGVRIVHADLAVPGELAARIGSVDFDVIVHGVCSFLEPAEGAPDESLTLRAMKEGLAFAKRCPQLRQFIYLSSNLPLGDIAPLRAADESTPCRPQTAHGRNKLAAEQLLESSSLPWVVLRMSQVYGGQHSSFDWVLLDPIRRAALPLPDGGKNLISLVHVDDVVQAARLCIERGVARRRFNIASGEQGLTLAAVCDLLAESFGQARPRRIPRTLALAYAMAAERAARWRGQAPQLIADMVRILSAQSALRIDAARESLGFRPAYPDSLAGLQKEYAEVFSGLRQPFVPAGKLEAVRGVARVEKRESAQAAFWQRWASFRHGELGQGSFADFMDLLGVQRDFCRFVTRQAVAQIPAGRRIAVLDLCCGAASLAGDLRDALREAGLTLGVYVGVDYGDQAWMERRTAAEFSRQGLTQTAVYVHHDLEQGLPEEIANRLSASGPLDALIVVSNWGLSDLPEDRIESILGQAALLAERLSVPALLGLNLLTAGALDRQALTRRFLSEVVPRELAQAVRSGDREPLRRLRRTFHALPQMRAFVQELREVHSLMPVAGMLKLLRRLAQPVLAVDRSLLFGQATCIAAQLRARATPTGKPIPGRAKIVVFTIPAIGHVHPLLPILAELVRRGDQVTYYCAENMRQKIEATGAEYRPIPWDFSSVEQDNPPRLCRLALESVRLTESWFPALLQELREAAPSYLLVDFMCLWGRLAGRALGLPVALMTSSFALGPGILPPKLLLTALDVGLSRRRAGMLFELNRRSAALSARHGVERLRLPPDLLSMDGDICLASVSRQFQPREHQFGERFFFVGPCFESRAGDAAATLPPLDERPLVYVSLGTVFNRQPAFFKSCIAAFADGRYQVILAIGKDTDPSKLGPVPPHVHVYPYVPQLAVLKRAAVFITHGGMNSTSEAISHGVPLLCNPQGADQFAIGARVAELGLGRVLGPFEKSPARLRAAVDSILADPRYKERCRALARSFAQAGGVTRAADVFQAFGREHTVGS